MRFRARMETGFLRGDGRKIFYKREDLMNGFLVFAVSFLYALLWATVLPAQDVKFRAQVKPLFDAHCLACHASDAPEYEQFALEKEKWLKKGIGMRMETFRHLTAFVLWPNTGALMRRLDDGKTAKDGKPGNMYEYLGSSEEERQKNLAVFKGWVGYWSLKRLPELSKEEILQLNKIRERY
jgi:mono/diheme cytochrome c family protein